MSFLKNMLTGFEGHAFAHNAHLAELVLRNLPAGKRPAVLSALHSVLRRGMSYRNLTDQQLDETFDGFPRGTQLNFLGLALKDLGLGWPGEQWLAIRNPSFTTMDAKDLRLSVGHFKQMYGLDIDIEGAPMRISQWVTEGRLSN